MARTKKSESLTAAVSKEIKANFNLDKFKEKKMLNGNVKFKEQKWIPLSPAFQEVTSVPGIPTGHIVLLRGHSDTGKTTALSTDASLIQKFLKEQPTLLEIQRKMTYDGLKEVLQNWLSPEEPEEGAIIDDENEPEVEVASPPAKAYALKQPLEPKASKAEKFDSLFADEDDNDLPF